MADAIATLLADESERKRLGSLARERAIQFSWNRMAAESARAYELAAD
jgi:glycosyltransferase involved in cell wall biosynthesis